MTIFGWDASDFDHDRGMRVGHIAAAEKQGVRFFTHKITEGTHVTHRHAGDKLKAARDAGIPFLGAYIVVRSGPTIRAQVDHAIAQTDRQAPWWRTFPGWFWQVDLEKWSYDQVPVARGPAMCTELERRSRHRAILYAPRWAYGNSIAGSDPLWASNYGNNATGDFRALYPGDSSPRWAAYSGRSPAILQYGSRATIGGQRTCDANAYRGTEAEFARLINAPNEEDDVSAKEVWDYNIPPGADIDEYSDDESWRALSILRSTQTWAYRATKEGRAVKAGQKAILAAIGGLDNDAILARIDQRAAEDVARDAALMELVEAGQSGQLDAAEVVRLIGAKLTAAAVAEGGA